MRALDGRSILLGALARPGIAAYDPETEDYDVDGAGANMWGGRHFAAFRFGVIVSAAAPERSRAGLDSSGDARFP